MASAENSPSKFGGGASSVRNDTLRPVTVKQLNDATQAHPDAEFLLQDGAELSQVITPPDSGSIMS